MTGPLQPWSTVRLRLKENVGYKILADLCQISIYPHFDHCMACIILIMG